MRTFNGWKDVEPGWFEMDLVAHCGGRMEGPFLWTLVLTDVASGWSGSASSMALCGCSPTSTSRRPSGFRLRRATVEKGAARVVATTNRSPRRIGYCVGVASVDNTAKALRRCNSNAIRWTCWRRFGGTKRHW